jgi:hypothetical protein
MTDPAGNAMYYVCEPCSKTNAKDFGIMAAGRTRVGFYETAAPYKQVNNWFMKHSKCGGRANPDHFKLGYGYPQNHDQQVKLKAI